jgi:hypothetical protein
MPWEELKHILGEIEEVSMKVAAAVSLFLIIIEILTRKVSDLIAKWKSIRKAARHGRQRSSRRARQRSLRRK